MGDNKTMLVHTAHLNARLAGANARVAQFAENLIEQTDRLVNASIDENWTEVSRLTEYIARGSEIYGYPQVADRAWRVYHELQRPDNAQGVKRSIVRLLGTCGRAPHADCAETA